MADKKYDTIIKYSYIGSDNQSKEAKAKSNLNTEEITDIEQFVAKSVINENGYFPNFKRLVMLECLIRYMTNIPLPDDLEKAHNFISSTNIDAALFELNEKLYFTLEDDIDSLIEYRKNELLTNKTSLAQFNDVMKSIKQVVETFESAFKGIDVKDFMSSIDKLNLQDMDEKKVVDLIVDKIRPATH